MSVLIQYGIKHLFRHLKERLENILADMLYVNAAELPDISASLQKKGRGCF